MLPVNAAMIIVGFVHKAECPADVRLPRYLFFGGLAGLMAIALRIVLVCSWRHVRKRNAGIKFDPQNHPGLSMVRSLMYIFLAFYVVWNVNATLHVFSVSPDLDDASSENYCHPAVYRYSYILVITFDAIAGIACLVWIAAIAAGICWPGLLIHYGYFIRDEDLETLPQPEQTQQQPSPKTSTVIVNVGVNNNHVEAKKKSPAQRILAWKQLVESSDDDSNEDRHALSIV